MRTLKTTIATASALVLTFAAAASANHCSSHSESANAAKASATTEQKMDIVATAAANGSFSTLVTAIEAAGLVEALQGEGPFTVFAPTDEAFAALPEGTIESLLKDKAKLTAVLTYHVLPGEVMAADAIKLNKAETLQGESITIKAHKEGVMIDNAKVVMTDIECSNGVIHVIDAVILPENMN
jgi:uncharacterized surface protein with fasciclin (FAS1) repeats